MGFNEQNSVENFIIKILSDVDLNQKNLADQELNYLKNTNWKYLSPEKLNRKETQIIIEDELRSSLIKLNPVICSNPELADEVIFLLNSILFSVKEIGLVKANEEFLSWLSGEKTMPFGENNQHIPINIIDFIDISKNSFIATNQFRVNEYGIKIPDIILLINGIPVVVGEAKTPTRPSISWLDGANDIHNIYENSIPKLFVPNILSFATEGKELYYGSIRCPLDLWSPWRVDKEEFDVSIGLKKVGIILEDLLSPNKLLDILRNFSIFSTNKRNKLIKIIPRFQQYEGANKIIERVIEGRLKKGLIWHFQGSGKSLLMVFAAQKLRRQKVLKSPTVIILIDRTDLDTQISSTFNAADVANVEYAETINDLQKMIAQDTRKIIISMIHKFRDAKPNMNNRQNIILLVDEAHRTQEGNLGRQMRNSLPNAFLFGLTGTPINKADKNTFWAFGSEEDKGGYMSRYTFHDSIRDGATLPLHFEPRLIDVHVDSETLEKEFLKLKNEKNLTDKEADLLNQKSAKMSSFLKSPNRVRKIVKDIAEHFKEKVAPSGLKALIVTPDRFACILYKEELNKYFPFETSAVVISTSPNDEFEFKQKWSLDKSAQNKIIENFNDPKSKLKFIIVTAKLLTGFDAPILQTMYLDKSLKDHTLLQAICRTNRIYPQKHFGRVVDYFGVFDDAVKALEFDEKNIDKVITNISELRGKLPKAINDALIYFKNIDRSLKGFEGLEAAQQALNTDSKKDQFAKDFKFLEKIWESLSPDKVLNLYSNDYKWLAQVYESVKPSSDNIGKLLWFTLGSKTTKLINENIHVGEIHNLEEFLLDADIIEDIFSNPDPKKLKKIEKLLIDRFKKYAEEPRFISLSERLESLRDKAEQGLISSIEFIKELCKIARDTLQIEKEIEGEKQLRNPKSALTNLFLEIKTDQTPIIVDRIVNEIDSIVRIVRFPGWQSTTGGEREVQKSLRKALLKYKLHKDQKLFERAYEYIKQYY